MWDSVAPDPRHELDRYHAAELEWQPPLFMAIATWAEALVSGEHAPQPLAVAGPTSAAHTAEGAGPHILY